ncbi:MAG: prepilin-type N-terminal cleavage/methylation domain-containing protein [Clostridium sp.]|uniref:prepilin-type N-terminal cleavage/methylation domain-containing protein n=1 Tax=Clostridium sp. TaxID=1506 RepID=UPI003F3BB19A
MKNKKKKGFTLVELIAVIAILAVLAAIAVPNVIKYIDNAKSVAAQTEAATIYNAATAAYTDGSLQGVTDKTQFDSLQVSKVPAKLFTKAPNDTVIPGTYTMTQLSAIMNESKDSVKFNQDGSVVVPTGISPR